MAEKTKLKAGCGIAMVFIAGSLCGAITLFLTLMWIVPLSEGWKGDESKSFITRSVARQLELTEKQISQARPVISSALDERVGHRKTFIEADITLTTAALEELKPILSEEQITKAEAMLRRWSKGKRKIVGKTED
tara:strand:- start:1958 stop:2362 length:405 start_codon:yes stop_codon:yes gene_type:complete